MRDIAAAAELNLGLIHRYVGSKDDVVELVMRRHTDRARRALESIADDQELLDLVAETIVDRPSTGPLVSGLIHEGIDVNSLKGEYPLLDHLARGRDPVQAAITCALALGWEVFGPSLLAAAGADPGHEELEAQLAATLSDVASRTPPTDQ